MKKEHKILFATDLDRTMIYSGQFIEDSMMDSLECVETNAHCKKAYMLKESIELRESLRKLIHFVPVTTRSRALYERLTLFQNSEYAIIENGATILNKGEVFELWDREIKQYLLKGDFARKLDAIQTLLQNAVYTKLNSVRWIGDKFVMCKTDQPEEMDAFLAQVLDQNEFNFTIQGRKVYIIPKGITKEGALSFLQDYLKIEYTFAAGDGKLDLGMLLHADLAFVPGDATLLKEIGHMDQLGIKVSKYTSFDATLDILKSVNERVRTMA